MLCWEGECNTWVRSQFCIGHPVSECWLGVEMDKCVCVCVCVCGLFKHCFVFALFQSNIDILFTAVRFCAKM